MIILLIFAFLSGLVTIAAPCIWPLLPIILSSTATGTRRKALGVTVGICASFALFTLTLSYIVSILPFNLDTLRLVAVVIIGFLGLTLVIPKLSAILEGYVSRLSGKLGNKTATSGQGFGSGLVTGAALGIVWTPCAGPILATIATLAATRTVNLGIIIVTIVYVIGVGIPLFLFAIAGNKLFTKSRFLSRYTGRVQQVFGVLMIITAALIFTNYDKVLQAKLLDAFPAYSSFLVKLESNSSVKQELDTLKGKKTMPKEEMPFPSAQDARLPDLGAAPEFTGITKWLNVEKPVTLKELRGKVILVDFWTYTCINCIRTLPHIVGWYEKYKNQDFVVVGVHTPEFEFEKKTENVQAAIEQYNIGYPVAQDNDYSTWNAYSNHYWPAKYLIDKDGHVRYTHFGEGEYDITEENIQKLLKEAGKKATSGTLNMPDQTPIGMQTPETYLGSSRMDRFASPEGVKEGEQSFTIPEGIPEHFFALGGSWNVTPEYSESVSNSSLEMHFYGEKVFLVITPKTSQDTVRVFLDGKLVEQSKAGADVRNGVATVNSSKLYNLIDLSKKESHMLKLEFLTPGTQVFAFTFG